MRHVSRELTLDAAISGPLLAAGIGFWSVPAPDRQATSGGDQSGKEADHFATPWLHAAGPKTAWYSSACLTGSPDCNLAGELLRLLAIPIRSLYRVPVPIPSAPRSLLIFLPRETSTVPLYTHDSLSIAH